MRALHFQPIEKMLGAGPHRCPQPSSPAPNPFLSLTITLKDRSGASGRVFIRHFVPA